ncbi:hypothetical protein PM082_021920 [Marasmius tenuissimus]|nr:hypothetical protein PM082_021920 [Marasmius tenuissimus]
MNCAVLIVYRALTDLRTWSLNFIPDEWCCSLCLFLSRIYDTQTLSFILGFCDLSMSHWDGIK